MLYTFFLHLSTYPQPVDKYIVDIVDNLVSCYDINEVVVDKSVDKSVPIFNYPHYPQPVDIFYSHSVDKVIHSLFIMWTTYVTVVNLR